MNQVGVRELRQNQSGRAGATGPRSLDALHLALSISNEIGVFVTYDEARRPLPCGTG
jgi:hypothetical protein